MDLSKFRFLEFLGIQYDEHNVFRLLDFLPPNDCEECSVVAQTLFFKWELPFNILNF